MTDTPTALDGPFRLLDDGTVEIDQDGETYTLRRPKLGQFKELKSLINDLNRYVKSIDKDAFSSDDTQDTIVGKRAAVLEAAFKSLCAASPPAEFDAWLVLDGKVLGSLLSHWQTVPLARG